HVHKFSFDEKARSPAHTGLGPVLDVLLNLGLELAACQAGLERFFIQPERLGSFDQTGPVELRLIRQQCVVILPELSLFLSAAPASAASCSCGCNERKGQPRVPGLTLP